MPRRFILAVLCCSAVNAEQLATTYGADFAGHYWKQEMKLTEQDIGTDIPEGVAPLRPVLQLRCWAYSFGLCPMFWIVFSTRRASLRNENPNDLCPC